jgi:hypothetical protein
VNERLQHVWTSPLRAEAPSWKLHALGAHRGNAAHEPEKNSAHKKGGILPP